MITVQERFKKGKYNNIFFKKNKKIPGIIYNSTYNKKILIDYQEYLTLNKIIKTEKKININIDNKEQLTVIIKDIQKNPITNNIMHIDFQKIDDNTIITQMVPLSFVNDKLSKGLIAGGILKKNVTFLKIKCKLKDMPNTISIDLTNLDIKDSLYLKDLNLAKNLNIILLNKNQNKKILIAKIIESKIITEKK